MVKGVKDPELVVAREVLFVRLVILINHEECNAKHQVQDDHDDHELLDVVDRLNYQADVEGVLAEELHPV